MPWLREAFSGPRLVLILVVGVLTRLATGICFDALSVPRGWSGIATFLAMYTVAFALPVEVDQRRASLIEVAFGSAAVAGVIVVAVVPLVVALVTMPGSGRVVDTASVVLVAVVLVGSQIVVVAWRLRKDRARRATRRR